jgi:hypothetical protein
MTRACEGGARRRFMKPLGGFSGEVAERSIAADCKSAAHVATEVRTLPSPPTFTAARVQRLVCRLEKVGPIERVGRPEGEGLGSVLVGGLARLARRSERARRRE